MSLLGFLYRAEKTPPGKGGVVSTGKDEEMFESITGHGRNGKADIPGALCDKPIGVSPKQLGWKMSNSGIELLLITPALAEAMLGYNTNNRPASPGTVTKYARQMRAGEWRLTRQPIIFSKSGRLQDGQHRLLACIESGVSIQAYVAFGDDDENFAFIDIGKVRGPSDVFAIHGVKNYAAMATATRWVMGYDSGTLSGGSSGLSITATPAELYAAFQTHPRLEESFSAFGWFATSRLASPSMMVALHYICARKNRAQADVFFESVGAGLGLNDRTAAAYKLHKRLVLNLGATAKLPQIMVAAFTIKAWNAQRQDKALGILRWRGEQKPDEAFPKAV